MQETPYLRNSEVNEWVGCVLVTPSRNLLFVILFLEWATDTGFILVSCRAIQTLCLLDKRKSYLFTDVSGTAIRTVISRAYRNLASSFGFRS